MEKTVFEQMGGTYTRVSNYYLPVLALPVKKENKPIGIWEQRHKRYLKEHRRILYYNLLTACKLNSYLVDIDRQAEEMFYQVVNQIAKAEGISEELKAVNQMRWVQRMNDARSRAMEIVNNEIIYA